MKKAGVSRSVGFILTNVTVRRQVGPVTVFLRGRGSNRYHVILVDAYLLALEFPSGSSLLSFSKLSVRHSILKEIRIIQYPKKLHLVFELTPHVRYAVKIGIEGLAIQFKL